MEPEKRDLVLDVSLADPRRKDARPRGGRPPAQTRADRSMRVVKMVPAAGLCLPRHRYLATLLHSDFGTCSFHWISPRKMSGCGPVTCPACVPACVRDRYAFRFWHFAPIRLQLPASRAVPRSPAQFPPFFFLVLYDVHPACSPLTNFHVTTNASL